MKRVLLFAFTLFLSGTQLSAQVIEQDRNVLLDIINSVDNVDDWGDDFNWLHVGVPVDEWEGVTVEGDRVVGIDIEMPRGIIPWTIGNLTELKTLRITGDIYGVFPEAICELWNLEDLSLYREMNDDNGGIDGLLPDAIGNLTSLKILNLSGHSLSGPIPQNIVNLVNLEEVNLFGNKFTGSIEAITVLRKLKFLSLQFNSLAGSIPATLTNLTNLESLSLAENQFTGSLEHLAALTNLTFLDVSDNYFSGAIPTELCNLSWPVIIFLRNNRFTFDGMECIGEKATQSPDGSFIFYDNQANIPIINNNPILSVTVGGTVENNTYIWHKDGTPIVGIAGDATFQISEPGIYYVQVYNSKAPDLVLTSEAIEITVVEGEGTLPLDFVDVKAVACASGACIEWKTANEQNTSHFEVEASTDGANFRKIGSNVNSRNTAGAHSYNAIDTNAAAGINYYRIKQVDKDGVYKYSKTVSVTISAAGAIVAAPNPSSGSFVLKGLDKADKISVYNMNGQLVKQWQNVIGNKQLNINNLSNGMYIIKIDQQQKQTILRLMKN